MRFLVICMLLLLPANASALVSKGRPGVPYYNHVLFLAKKIVEEGRVTWVTLAYGDSREQTLECRNTIDVFNGRELFGDIPEKSWVLVDYELQSILIEEGFLGDADVFKVRPCASVEACCELRDQLNDDPGEIEKRQKRARPAKTKTAKLGDIENQLEVGRQLVKATRCRGCHVVEGFGADHAPSLTWRRYKYEPGWLKAFLRAPYRLRPAMTDLMMLKYTSPNARPNMKEEEADAVAGYLARVAWTKSPADRFRAEQWADYDCYDCHSSLYRVEPLSFVPTPVPDALRKGFAAEPAVQACFSCHAFGDFKLVKARPGQSKMQVFAPDLLLAMEKLEAGYFVSFVRDPHYLQPGALMPRLDLSDEQLAMIEKWVLAVKEAIASGTVVPVHNFYEMEKRE